MVFFARLLGDVEVFIFMDTARLNKSAAELLAGVLFALWEMESKSVLTERPIVGGRLTGVVVTVGRVVVTVGRVVTATSATAAVVDTGFSPEPIEGETFLLTFTAGKVSGLVGVDKAELEFGERLSSAVLKPTGLSLSTGVETSATAAVVIFVTNSGRPIFSASN